MAKFPVSYTEFRFGPSPAFSRGGVFRRPILRLTIANGPHYLSCYALVDSGADYCAFPLSFASSLLLDRDSAALDSIGGVGSNTPAYFWNIELRMQGFDSIPLYAGFTEGLNQWGLGLLGQNGFFDRFKVSFDMRNGLFEIES